MPLYIRDDAVAALATELTRATGASSKTEAVRTALQEALRRKQEELPLAERIKKIQDRARAVLGPPDPNFNFKKFREELWGDED